LLAVHNPRYAFALSPHWQHEVTGICVPESTCFARAPRCREFHHGRYGQNNGIRENNRRVIEIFHNAFYMAPDFRPLKALQSVSSIPAKPLNICDLKDLLPWKEESKEVLLSLANAKGTNHELRPLLDHALQ
jgi:hypothetical protein